nr:hypothetical protein [Tanacetum cinerariifolium]
MEKGEGKEDINSILKNFTSKMSHIMNRDGNDKEEQVPHEAGVTSATSTHVENPKQNEQSGWEDANIQAMKNTMGNPKSSFVNVVLPWKKGSIPSCSKLCLEQVLEKGSWMIRNQPLILTKWAPNLELAKDAVTKVPVWVKIHKVPVVAYSEDGLSMIASQIGKPKPTAKNDEVDSIKIKNNFSVLQDDDTIFATQEVHETSTKNDDTYVRASSDSESEVEEMGNEFNVKNDTNKGASTPSDDILNV